MRTAKAQASLRTHVVSPEPFLFAQTIYGTMVYFFIFILLANSEDLDQTPRSAASDLGLHCLHMSQKWDTRLIWVKAPVLKRRLLYFTYFPFKACDIIPAAYAVAADVPLKWLVHLLFGSVVFCKKYFYQCIPLKFKKFGHSKNCCKKFKFEYCDKHPRLTHISLTSNFMGHRQTVQTQMRRHRMGHLIRVFTVCL